MPPKLKVKKGWLTKRGQTLREICARARPRAPPPRPPLRSCDPEARRAPRKRSAVAGGESGQKGGWALTTAG